MFALKRACSDCPFRKQGGIRLNEARTREIAGYFIDASQSSTFPCHKTVDYDNEDEEDGDRPTSNVGDWQMCAGGMIFADKAGQLSTMMQLGTRLGLMKIDELQGRDEIVDTLDELLALAQD